MFTNQRSSHSSTPIGGGESHDSFQYLVLLQHFFVSCLVDSLQRIMQWLCNYLCILFYYLWEIKWTPNWSNLIWRYNARLYEAEVSFIEIPERNTSTSSSNNLQKGSPLNQTRMKERLGKMICGSNCSICMNGFDFSEIDERSLLSMYPSEKGSRWKHSKGSFISIGAAVMSCRNDKAPNGVAANAHLADGLMHLILIKNCSRLAYLW